MSDKPTKPTWRLTLTPEGSSVAPDIINLRRLLKRLLREYAMRLVSIEEVKPRDDATPRRVGG